MSDDFITALQHDLVEAMERYERRGARRRVPAVLRAPLLKRVTLLRIAAATALAVAVLAVVRNLAPESPPVRPRVVEVLPIGGTPVDAALADGSLWATDFTGWLVQVDPDERRVVTRIKVAGAPGPVAESPGSVWVRTSTSFCEGTLLRLDASNGRTISTTPLAAPDDRGIGGLAFAAGGVWGRRSCNHGASDGVDRIAAGGAVTARVNVPDVDGVASGAGSVWAFSNDGTVTQIDAASARVTHRWPRLAPLADPTSEGTKALVADDTGAWVLSTRRAALLRIEGGHVAREIAVDPSVRPLVAGAPDGLWIATADRLQGHNRLIRISPATGRATATVALGERRPVALVAAAGQLCVVTADGKVLFIRS